MNTEIVSYNPTKAALADLTTRYKGLVFDVRTAKGLTEAKSAYKDINKHSLALEEARKKEKAESLAYGRFVDSEAERIAEQLDSLRLPIKEQIETETKREEREQAALIEAARLGVIAKQEAERVELKRQQEELAKAIAEQARIAAEARAKIEAEERASRMKIEEEQRQERLARQAREEAERVKRQVEEERLKAERDKADAARREAEAAIREAERIKNELLDGNNVLRMFVQKYGKREEFASVVPAIVKYLEGVK